MKGGKNKGNDKDQPDIHEPCQSLLNPNYLKYSGRFIKSSGDAVNW